MWTCHKCGKPVYFAERKQSLGYDWHPECLRCEECGKRLNPGQHAEHKGVPYCHIPCYGALFGPTLFGHGSQVESHKSFGKIENRPGTPLQRSRLEAKLRLFNQYYEGKSQQLKCRERNGKLILEGVLRIYWGVNNLIHLRENEDQRTHVQVRKRNSYRLAVNNSIELEDSDVMVGLKNTKSSETITKPINGNCHTATDENDKNKFDVQLDCESDDITNQLLSESKNNKEMALPETMTPNAEKIDDEKCAIMCLPLSANNRKDFKVCSDKPTIVTGILGENSKEVEESPLVRIRKMASSRSKTKLKRRCSINGHYYNRETSVFTPPHGSATNVWVTSLVNSPEVINMLLDKFCVENNPEDFALFIVRDNGETRIIQDHEYPLLVRVILGPHEDVAKVFIMDKSKSNEISSAVAQFLNLTDTELNAIVRRFYEEEEREMKKIKRKYRDMKRRIQCRISELQLQQKLKENINS